MAAAEQIAYLLLIGVLRFLDAIMKTPYIDDAIRVPETSAVSPLTPVPQEPTPSIVWHYTVGAAIKKILADGELHLSTMGKGREKSILWFSANSDWEISATKRMMHTKDNKSRNLLLGKEGTKQLFGGLYRIGVSPSLLTSWADLR